MMACQTPPFTDQTGSPIMDPTPGMLISTHSLHLSSEGGRVQWLGISEGERMRRRGERIVREEGRLNGSLAEPAAHEWLWRRTGRQGGEPPSLLPCTLRSAAALPSPPRMHGSTVAIASRQHLPPPLAHTDILRHTHEPASRARILCHYLLSLPRGAVACTDIIATTEGVGQGGAHG